MKELINQIALLKVNGIGPRTIRKLISDFASTQNLFKATKKDFQQKYQNRGEKIYKLVQEGKQFISEAATEYEYCKRKNYEISSFYDNNYPNSLRHCTDAPLILYQSGNIDLNENTLLSIVGTRTHSKYGEQVVENVIDSLKNYQVTIVSGLARGIDYLTHHFCVQNDIPNIAILGHGLDNIYPKYHSEIKEKIKNNGALISEFNPTTKPSKYNFPKRNRIIAGISSATLVIESPIRGGAMITAGIANSYNRDVFAVPGNFFDQKSMGCNYLIYNNEAHLLDNSKTLIKMLDLKERKSLIKNKRICKEEKIELKNDEKKLFLQLEENMSLNYDFLMNQLNVSIEQLQNLICSLEIKGCIELHFGNKIKIIK